MQTYHKKRIEIIIEAPLIRRITDHLDRLSVPGYSVVPILAGRGHDGAWSAEGQIGNAAQMVGLVCVIDASKVDAVVEAIFGLISHQIGMITISDVSVVRPERF